VSSASENLRPSFRFCHTRQSADIGSFTGGRFDPSPELHCWSCASSIAPQNPTASAGSSPHEERRGASSTAGPLCAVGTQESQEGTRRGRQPRGRHGPRDRNSDQAPRRDAGAILTPTSTGRTSTARRGRRGFPSASTSSREGALHPLHLPRTSEDRVRDRRRCGRAHRGGAISRGLGRVAGLPLGLPPLAAKPQKPRADARTRTGDPFITSEVLYQLSYVGNACGCSACNERPHTATGEATSTLAAGRGGMGDGVRPIGSSSADASRRRARPASCRGCSTAAT
jgi:hypothetical protein